MHLRSPIISNVGNLHYCGWLKSVNFFGSMPKESRGHELIINVPFAKYSELYHHTHTNTR